MGDVWNYSAASTSVAAVSMNPLEATEPSLNNQLLKCKRSDSYCSNAHTKLVWLHDILRLCRLQNTELKRAAGYLLFS